MNAAEGRERTRAGGGSAGHKGVVRQQRVAAIVRIAINVIGGVLILRRCFGTDPRAVHQPGLRAVALQVLKYNRRHDGLHATARTVHIEL